MQDGGASAALVAERDALKGDLRVASEALRETVDRLELFQVQRQQMETALRRFDARLAERDRCGPTPPSPSPCSIPASPPLHVSPACTFPGQTVFFTDAMSSHDITEFCTDWYLLLRRS